MISFDIPGFQFRARKTIWNGKAAHGFMPAALRACERSYADFMTPTFI
jgi:hypothetical protein